MLKRIIFKVLSTLLFFVGGINTTAETNVPLKNGDKVQVIVEHKKTIEENGFKLESLQGFVAGYDNDILFLSSQWDIRIDRAVMIDGNIVEYPYTGAKYDSTSKSISGLDKNGNVISIPITEIEYIDVMLLVKNNQIMTKVFSNTLHNRLRYVNSYPELLYKIPFDSVQEVKRWQKGSSSTIIIGALAGGVIGYIFIDTEEPENLKDSITLAVIEPYEPIGIAFSVIGSAVIGGLIGYLIGKSRWQDIPIDELKVNLKPDYNNGIGFSLLVRF